MHLRGLRAALAALLLSGHALAPAATRDATDPTAGLTRQAGLIDLYPGAEGNQILAGVPIEQTLLLVSALPGSLGSNEVGLDRNQLSSPRLVSFRRVGDRLAPLHAAVAGSVVGPSGA